MVRRKKEIKRIFFVVLFVITVFLSNVQILSNIDVFQDERTNNETVLDELPLSSNLDLNDIITGSGVNQDVRIYVNNESENLLNNENYFEIPSLPTEDMYLSYGNFNFTFQNNFTTDYIIEDDNALYANDFISFDFDTGASSININNGTIISGGYSQLVDGNENSNIYLNAENGLLNFTVSADFTDTTFTSGVIIGNVKFNRTRILALISSLIFRIYSDANLTIRIRDYSQPTWKEVISNLPINSSLNKQEVNDHFINENLNFIDLTSICYIEFSFERFDKNQFYARLYEYDLQATYAFDLPITSQEYVALEFDLKGESSAVNGFYAWIRTLDLVEAATSQLNITLYRANRTVVRTDANLRNVNLGPNYNEMIDSKLVSYTGDNLSYFDFNLGNTGNLNLDNYFIVIKSDNSKEIYSLVALPWFSYGDSGETEHQLKTTSNDGGIWRNARKVIETTNQPYTSGQLDASSFKLDVTRGYMPSDFIVNSVNTLRIQEIPIENLVIKSYPYNESSYLTWGLGRWNNPFPTAIEDDAFNNFQVDLTWDNSIIKGFQFTVNYSVNAYWVESSSATYSVTYNEDPEWLLTYNLQKGDPNFNNWDFLEFWYVYPNFLTAHNLTDPDNTQILGQTGGQTALSEDPTKNKVVVKKILAIPDGFYNLNLTSFNFIRKMNSYINYNDILWESNGFMNGDNISVSVKIQDHYNKAPISGDANATLFYPDGTRFTSLPQDLVGEIEGSSLTYDFDNQTILDVTNALTIFGKYHLGFFWFNGSAIGCKKIILYIDIYDLELYECEYDSIKKTNVLDGKINKKVFSNFTLLIASINDTTGLSLPNFYPIDNENIDTQFSLDIDDERIPVLLTSFKQSQNILNPNEIVNIKTSIQNLHPFISVRVKINVKLVSFMNDKWIIAEDTSSSIILKFSGHPNDNNEFDINLTIPDLNEATNIWLGKNAPIRLGGAKTLITVYVENVNVGIFESTDISLLSNKTSNDFEGHIIGLRLNEEVTSAGILNEFNRDECIYLPNKTKFLVNIIDRNYVSTYKQYTGEFTLKLNSKFKNITIDPTNPIKGHSFNLNSILTTEFGDELANRNVTCQYYDSGVWINIGSDITDSNGFTTFLIDTQTIDFEGDLLIRLSWVGNTINGVSKNITVDVIHQANSLLLSIKPITALIYQRRISSFSIKLLNNGDSNLRITNITIELNRNQQYSITQIDYIKLSWFPAGETTLLIVEVSVIDVSRVRISISITAQNIITNESILVSREETYNTFEVPIFDYIIQNLMLIIIAIFVLTWIIAILFARRAKKRIETPIEEPVKKPRRKRYVPVAELKKPPAAKIVAKKKEEPKEEEKIDLDSLLEERGLVDKKKKSKE